MQKLKARWNAFRREPAGRRFVNQYLRNRRGGGFRPAVVLHIGLGLLLLVAGGILCVIPGPGIPVLAAGAVMVGGEIRPVARFLDWLELQLRKFVRMVRRDWRAASVPLRGLMLLGVLAAVGAAGYGAAKIVLGV